MINLLAPINNLGYGVAGLNFTRELYRINKSLTLYPISQPENVDDTGIVASAINNQYHYDSSLPCVKIWHQHDLQQKIGNGTYFGFPIFELNKFNSHEKVSLNHCDQIIVCSNWAKDIIVAETKFTKDDVHVVPLGVDQDIFRPVLNINKRPTTIFLNCGKWEKRKGHDFLVEVFNEAFSESDDVELWMMCDNPFIGNQNESWRSLYKNSKLNNKIRIIPRQQTQVDVYKIMCLSDCGIFPSRAEGWNLEVLEMMSVGKQVITTNYSAHTEFCNMNNSRLIEIDNLETAIDGLFFDGSCGFWAELSDNQLEQTIHHMRSVHKEKQEKLLKINTCGIGTAQKFSWKDSARELLNVCRT